MDELGRLDGPDGSDRPDEHDLELVARLWTEAAPDDETTARHHRQLVAAISAAGGLGARGPSSNGATPSSPSATAMATTTGRTDADPGVVDLAPAPAGRSGRRSRRRLLAAAAAVAVIAGGLLAVSRFAPDRDGTDDTVAGPSPAGRQEQHPCGSELPLSFPVPAGFEGPIPGPSGEVTDPDGATEALQQHWRNEQTQTTIDARWPSSMVIDPTTPLPPGATTRTLGAPEQLGEGAPNVKEAFHSDALGSGECNGLDVSVTSADAASGDAVLDQIEMGLLGPGGPLVPDRPLVTGVTTAAIPPVVDEAGTCPGTLGGPVEGAAAYPSPREALGFHAATNLTVPLEGYQEVELPDGSFAYTYDPQPDLTTAVVHVVPSPEGWRVASWESAPC